MVIRLAVFLLGTALFALPARGDAISMAIANFGLAGNWADNCSNGNARSGIRLIIAAPPVGPSTYESVSIDDGVKTRIRSVVLSADTLMSVRLKLRMRIVGGNVDGGPLPSPTTNTFEQTFEKLTGSGLRMVGNPPIPLTRCGD